MSQAGSNSSSGSSAVLQITADAGIATPLAGNINLNGDGISIHTGASGDTVVIAYAPTYTNVTNAMSPYSTTVTDNFISVNVTAGAVTIRLPNAPASSRVFTIKDRVGLAGANNITITTVGGAVNIDGATSFVMNTAYEAMSLLFNGTSYEIY